jgi:hypothetical protein
LTKQPNDQTLNVTENEVSEPPEQTTMVLWDINHTSYLDDLIEEEEPPEILVVQTRSKGLLTSPNSPNKSKGFSSVRSPNYASHSLE